MKLAFSMYHDPVSEYSVSQSSIRQYMIEPNKLIIQSWKSVSSRLS